MAISGANVYFTWVSVNEGDTDIVLRRSTDNGATLKPLVQISNNGTPSNLQQVTADGTVRLST